MNIAVVISALEPAKSEALGNRLALPVTDVFDTRFDAALVFVAGRLELHQHTSGPICVDFNVGDHARRRATSSKHTPLAKAIGLKKCPPKVIDATAGLGRDAFVLASLGCSVSMIEKHPIIAALLADGLTRLMGDTPSEHLTLYKGDATQVITALPPHDVIYLDPMYPHSNKHALPHKEMQLFRALLHTPDDEAALLHCAQRHAPRVVVKRPKHASPLAHHPPTQKLTGKTTRYDLYLQPSSAPDIG